MTGVFFQNFLLSHSHKPFASSQDLEETAFEGSVMSTTKLPVLMAAHNHTAEERMQIATVWSLWALFASKSVERKSIDGVYTPIPMFVKKIKYIV